MQGDGGLFHAPFFTHLSDFDQIDQVGEILFYRIQTDKGVQFFHQLVEGLLRLIRLISCFCTGRLIAGFFDARLGKAGLDGFPAGRDDGTGGNHIPGFSRVVETVLLQEIIQHQGIIGKIADFGYRAAVDGHELCAHIADQVGNDAGNALAVCLPGRGTAKVRFGKIVHGTRDCVDEIRGKAAVITELDEPVHIHIDANLVRNKGGFLCAVVSVGFI